MPRPVTPSLKSRIPWPRPRPISGSFLAPNTRSTTRRTIAMCTGFSNPSPTAPLSLRTLTPTANCDYGAGGGGDHPHARVRRRAAVGVVLAASLRPGTIDARADGTVQPRRLGPGEDAEERPTPHRRRAAGRARRDPASSAARARRLPVPQSAGNGSARALSAAVWRPIQPPGAPAAAATPTPTTSGTLPRRYNASALSRPRTPLSNWGAAGAVAPKVQ